VFPAPNQVAQSDAVVLGKVESIAEKTVTAKKFLPGQTGDAEYQLATVKVQEGLLAAKGLTHVEVAWVPTTKVIDPHDRKPPFSLQPNVTKDLEGCFFLVKHPTESFYVLVNSQDVVNKSNKDFEKYADLIKKCSKLIDDPEQGLKSNDASERLLAARLLMTRYRVPKAALEVPPIISVRPEPRPTPGKQEPIDADESKLILQTMIDADWSEKIPELGGNAARLFDLLNLSATDGWDDDDSRTPIQDKRWNAMKKWLKKNVGTYRVKRFVREEAQK
jgi:hypothetical protein